jgi:hypothetical protein
MGTALREPAEIGRYLRSLREVRVDLAYLRPAELELLARVRGDAGALTAA